MRELLRRLGQMGKTIVVSSHILPELADICNKIGIIDRGVMTVNSDVADVMQQIRRKIGLHIRVTGDPQKAAEIVSNHSSVDTVELVDDQIIVSLHEDETDYSVLAQLLVEAGHGILLFQEESVNLEKAFMMLTKGTGVNF